MPSNFATFIAALLGALLAAAPCAWAGPRPQAAFDRARVHADYQAGDFEKVIPALEAFLESGARCRKEDSVFLEKHLSVVYAANPATRERGRYHMMRMLELDPGADLLDMFVGEEVDRIFEKVRKESRMRPADGMRVTAPAPRSAGPSAPAPALRGPRPAPRLETWNLGPEPGTGPAAPMPAAGASTAPMPAAARASAPVRVPASAGSADRGGGPEAADAGPSLRPRWREPGFWVGGGAVVAVVGLTLYFSGARSETDNRSRTFAVPATAAE